MSTIQIRFTSVSPPDPCVLFSHWRIYYKLLNSVSVWDRAGRGHNRVLEPKEPEWRQLWAARWCGCWDLDSWPFQEQYMLLTPEVSLQPCSVDFRYKQYDHNGSSGYWMMGKTVLYFLLIKIYYYSLLNGGLSFGSNNRSYCLITPESKGFPKQ